jgi:serine/threonine protein kinase/WD40 repeat protein
LIGMTCESYSRDADADARLEAIIEAAVDDLASGAAINVEAVAAAHPQFAAPLRELLPMVLTMANLGGAMRQAHAIGEGSKHDAPERTLGDFRILRELGRGGMGTVFEAEQKSMGRRVALKVLPFAALADDKALRRFRNEVRAAASLDHPHVVSVYSVGEERGVHYYAMQLIRGQTLAEWIERLRDPSQGRGATAPHDVSQPSTARIAHAQVSTHPVQERGGDHYRTVARVAIQAAEALQYAHDQGVLHRDVKPSNLMLDAQGELFITDFGLARIEADAGLTMTGDLVGTLRYMAPEQAAGKRVVIDHRADVYSLGASLYELLTLAPAFGDSARAELLKKIAFEEPPRPQHRDQRIPAELDTIVLKAMAKEPDERYQSAQLMAEDLRAFVDNRPIKARPASVHDRLRKWTRRHQTMAVVLALSLLALSVILAGSIYLVNRARTTAVAALEQSAESASRLADQLYDADVSLAYQQWEKGWSHEAPALLERHRPPPGETDRRRYEWHLLRSLVREPTPVVLAGHDGPVNEMAIFPDGRRLASVGNDGTLRIWDAAAGTVLKTLAICATPLVSVAISPDGRRVAIGNNAIYLCDLEREDDVVEIFRNEHNAESLAFSPNGDRLAVGFRYHEICILSLDGAVINRAPCEARVESLEFLPRKRQLIVPNRGGPANESTGIVQLWSDDANYIDGALATPSNTGFTIARPSPCGQYVAAASRYSGSLAFVSVATRQLITMLPAYRDQANDLNYSPDGTAVAVAYRNGVIRYFRLGGDDEASFWVDDRVKTLGAHQGAINAVRFLAPGLLATCGNDGLIKIWDVGRAERMAAFKMHESPGLAASLSPDGKRVIAVSYRETVILDADNGQVLFRQPQADIDRVRTTWSQRSDLAAIWEGTTNAITIRAPHGQVKKVIPNDDCPEDVDFSPDSRRIAIIGGNLLRLFDLQQNKTIVKRKLPSLGLAVALAHHADVSAYGGRFGEVILASAEFKRVWRSLPCDSDATCLSFSPDDLWLASGHADGVIRIWSVETGKLQGEVLGHDGSLTSLVFTSDGNALLSSANDGSVRIASTLDYRSFGVLCSRADKKFIVTASSSGQRIAALAYKGNAFQPDVLLWNINVADVE